MSENNSVAGIFSGHGQIKTPTYKEQAYRLIKEAILYQRFQADKKRNIFAVLAAAGYGLASGHVNDSKDDRGDGAENGRQLDPCALTAAQRVNNVHELQ